MRAGEHEDLGSSTPKKCCQFSPIAEWRDITHMLPDIQSTLISVSLIKEASGASVGQARVIHHVSIIYKIHMSP